jgi:serine-type D-Ala-D-Ala carboxypeptidase (penicillin-binding protein 5/6)
MERRAAGPVAVVLSAFAVMLLGLPLASAAGQGRDVPPPTPVAVAGGRTSPSPFPTALDTPAPSATVPRLAVGSAILADLDTGQILLATDGEEKRPIASLTKLMTALLVLKRTDPGDVVTVSSEASTSVGGYGISELGLETGERITVEQLLYALLLQSANDAAVALAEHVSGSVPAFVKAMNAEAARLGMRHTRFYSPNGLDDRGYSTALDVARLTRAAYAQPMFARIDATRFHEIPSPAGPPRIVQNRNVMLWLYDGAIGGKTGYTSAAGFCVAAAAAREGMRLVAVVLGAPGEPFSDAAELLNYGFAAFDRKRLVQAGQPFDAVDVQGRPIAVAATEPLDALVPADAQIAYRVVPRRGVPYPPALGEPVATLRVETRSAVLRRMPLVAASVPPPPAPDDPGPWWRRAGAAVADALSSAMSAVFG